MGYGQCSYLRFVNSSKRVHIALICSKGRVTPLKAITVPRLELQAARGAVDLSLKAAEELSMDHVAQYFYTDSEVVLGYIKNTQARYHTFVANRVQQICDGSNADNWFHVRTKLNPADHASRGLSPKQIFSPECIWFTGPDFLWNEPIILPHQKKFINSHDDQEVKVSIATQHTFAPLSQRLNIYSNLDYTLKVIARIQTALCKTPLTQQEKRQKALHSLVKSVQSEFFTPEIKQLQQNQTISKHSSIAKLCPFLDKVGLLRVGGRLQNSKLLSFEEKHPLLLPKHSHLTTPIINDVHAKLGHLGLEYTLSKIRSQGF